jgi:DnaJ-class molecular chaperone
MKDHYKILGVAPTDTKEKIQEIYRNISKNYRAGIKSELKSFSEAKMKQIIAAYNILNDDAQRRDYDAQPQFQVRRTSQKLVAVQPKKPKDEKKPFKWGLPIMDIILMPFKKADAPQADQTPEEKAQMHFTLGVSMAEDKENYERAKNEFLLAMKFIPDFREACYNAGLLAYRQGHYDEALDIFKKTLQIESRDLHAKKMLELLDDK